MRLSKLDFIIFLLGVGITVGVFSIIRKLDPPNCLEIVSHGVVEFREQEN
jgi:hypothetical protein